MDPLDIRILCQLGFCLNLPPYATDRRPDPWKVAKELGVDGKTVKLRMEKWERTGFIKYYQVLPNYNLLGIKSSAYVFSPGDIVKKYQVLKKVELVEGVINIINFLGDSFLLWLAYEDDAEMSKRVALLAEVTGSPAPPKFLDEEYELVNFQLSALDWQIVKCLRYNALKHSSTIARDCGVTRKTVNAHLERMVDKRAFFLRAIFDASAVSGLVFYSLAIVLDREQRKDALRALDRMFRERSFARYVPSQENILYTLWATSVGETEDSHVKASSVAGVLNVSPLVLKEVIEFPELLDKLIDKRIAETAKRPLLVKTATRGSSKF
jgi:DNA-binding Lrp family transcriptional regulator